MPLNVTVEQQTELQRLVKAPATPQNFVRRAKIVLLAAAGRDNAAIAATLNTSRPTVGRWRQRFAAVVGSP